MCLGDSLEGVCVCVWGGLVVGVGLACVWVIAGRCVWLCVCVCVCVRARVFVCFCEREWRIEALGSRGGLVQVFVCLAAFVLCQIYPSLSAQMSLHKS